MNWSRSNVHKLPREAVVATVDETVDATVDGVDGAPMTTARGAAAVVHAPIPSQGPPSRSPLKRIQNHNPMPIPQPGIPLMANP